MLPDLPNGDFVAAVKLVSPDGIPLGDEFHHDVGFSVNTEHPSPYSTEDWPVRRRAVMEAMCPPSSDCTVMPDDGSIGTVCSGHGRCVRGACVCDANWCGETCAHAILENSSYFPAVDPASAAARCIKSLWWNNGTELLADSLLGIARRSSCRQEQILLFDVLAPSHAAFACFFSEACMRVLRRWR